MVPADFFVRLDMMNMCTKFRFSMSIWGEGIDVLDFAGGAMTVTKYETVHVFRLGH